METVDPSLGEQSKKMRDLLASLHSQDLSPSSSYNSKSFTLDAIDSASFNADQYMNILVQRSSLEGLLQKHIQMAAEIKNLDTDLQMLVYENYNKFISATDTIKRMKSNIVGMEGNMEQLLQKILTVQSRSDGVNTSLYEKRENIEKLHLTRNLLRKVQFIYDLPSRLGKCIKSEAYEEAVKYYTGASSIFKMYGDSSFQDCKRSSEEAMAIIVKNLQEKLSSDSEPIQARARAAVLLKKLNYPVEYLKARLFEKMEQSVEGLQLNLREPHLFSDDGTEHSRVNEKSISINELSEAIRAYRVIFPESEDQLLKLSQDLITRHFDITNQHIKVLSAENLMRIFAVIWNDMLLLEEVMPEALLPELSLDEAKVSVRDFIDCAFNNLLDTIFDAILRFSSENKSEMKSSLQNALEAGKTAVLKGSIDLLLKLTQFLTEKSGLLFKTRNLIIDWVQEGFQNFFNSLNDRFFTLSKPSTQTMASNQDVQIEKHPAGLTLVLSQLSVFIEQFAIPKIAEEIANCLSGGGSGGSDNGPAFVPGELCRSFRSSSDKLLSQYINLRTQRVSILLKKRFSTPLWIKHKEPRDVHMFVDLLLQELEATSDEVAQILPGGPTRKHHRSESNGSNASGRTNTATRPNPQKGRSQLLETHLAKLFKQKIEIFTKVKHTQESALSTIVKLCLKSLQELVRLQSFNRSGFQQIQLDVQFLRAPLKDCVEDEAAVDFLLDEVIVGASERCYDPVPLEPPILEKLIQAKLAKGNNAPAS